MDIPPIRELSAHDLHDALALSTSAGWNQQFADWRLLRTLAAGSAFAAVSGERVLGTALAIDYRGFAWIAMMLVEPAWRGRGLGGRLLEAALQTVPSNRPIRLDATEAGRPLYRRYGFQDESRLTRLVAPAVRPRIGHGIGAVTVRTLTPADLPVVERHDAGVFGGDRRAVLEWALDEAPHYALVVDGDGSPPQYTFGRPGRLFDQIGPVVAAGHDSATALVRAALAAASGRAVVLDAFDARPTFTTWLRACGFAGERPLFRMQRPARPAGGARSLPSSEFAILGPDFG
jgi:GNAT superfamily N-acetyltransferase